MQGGGKNANLWKVLVLAKFKQYIQKARPTKHGDRRQFH